MFGFNGHALSDNFLSVCEIHEFRAMVYEFYHLKEQIEKIDSEGTRQAIDFITDETEHRP